MGQIDPFIIVKRINTRNEFSLKCSTQNAAMKRKTRLHRYSWLVKLCVNSTSLVRSQLCLKTEELNLSLMFGKLYFLC